MASTHPKDPQSSTQDRSELIGVSCLFSFFTAHVCFFFFLVRVALSVETVGPVTRPTRLSLGSLVSRRLADQPPPPPPRPSPTRNQSARSLELFDFIDATFTPSSSSSLAR